MALRGLAFLAVPGLFAASIVTVGTRARASGGLVASPQGASSIAEVEVVVATAPGRTTRWARLRVRGAAGAFVWVLPVRPGGMVDLASDAWMEALQASTAPRVEPPAAAPPCDVKGGIEVPARIDHVSTRAPSDVAVVADVPALVAQLHEWGFVLPSDLHANVETTLAGGSSLALLLFPGAAIDMTTRTVRVVDDAPPVLPLLLTSGASAGVAVTAFLVGDARAELGAVPMFALSPASIMWRVDGTSTYRDARAAGLAASPDAWLVESAGLSQLFQVRTLPGATIPAIADSYFARAGAYGDVSADATSCAVSAHGASASTLVVASACPLGALARVAGPNGPPTCVESMPIAQLSPDPFRCGSGADDLAHAFALHVPSGTWVTRAAGVVPAGVFGEDVPVVPGNGGGHDPVLRASKYDVVCSGTPSSGGGYSGGSGGGSGGGGGTPAGGPPSGAVVGTDDTTGSDAAAVAGDTCSGFADSGCGGDSSSSDSCGGGSSAPSDGSSSGCGGSSSSSDSSSSGCGGSSAPSDSSGCGGGGGSSSNCTTTRRPQRSPFSRWALGALGVVALLRRASRRRA